MDAFFNMLHSHIMYIQKAGKWISWKHVESLFLHETATTTPGIRLAHKLTREHVWLTPYAKMRVNLAAQVCLTYVIYQYNVTMLYIPVYIPAYVFLYFTNIYRS